MDVRCQWSRPSFGGARGGEARVRSDEGSAATGEEKNKVRLILNVLAILSQMAHEATQ